MTTKRLVFGTNLAGPGRTWIKQGTLEEVGSDVPVSDAWVPDSVKEMTLGDASKLGVDETALDHLVARAEEAESDALVVFKDGQLLLDMSFEKDRGRIETMSVTKAIVGLAIGKLVDQGKIASIDAPLKTWFPQWSKDAHAKITLRMILDHTSCLRSAPTTEEVYASQDWVQLALDAELVCDPGARASYNNKAVALLAPIVETASGKRLDAYVRDEIFTPLGIKDFKWSTDPAGHPQCMAGLELRAFDLAKIGQMLVDGGMWHGTRVLSEAWIKRATQDEEPHSTFGLLWWRMTDGSRIGYDAEHIDAYRQAHVSKANDTIIPKLGSDVASVPGPFVGFQANGWLGQYLVVLPREHLVAVRMMRAHPGADEKALVDFPALVTKLVHPAPI